eukprot:Sspe_Gene.24132::Locus_9489_Transcript_1_1_Confidence_1.000_Length_356::g.24132::m.24132
MPELVEHLPFHSPLYAIVHLAYTKQPPFRERGDVCVCVYSCSFCSILHSIPQFCTPFTHTPRKVHTPGVAPPPPPWGRLEKNSLAIPHLLASSSPPPPTPLSHSVAEGRYPSPPPPPP